MQTAERRDCRGRQLTLATATVPLQWRNEGLADTTHGGAVRRNGCQVSYVDANLLLLAVYKLCTSSNSHEVTFVEVLISIEGALSLIELC